MVEILQKFVAFSEYMNFIIQTLRRKGFCEITLAISLIPSPQRVNLVLFWSRQISKIILRSKILGHHFYLPK